MAPQSREGQKLKKQTTECYKGRFLKHLTMLLPIRAMLGYVGLGKKYVGAM